MTDRETPYSNRRQRSAQTHTVHEPTRSDVTHVVAAVMFLTFLFQLLISERGFGARWLSVSWESTILGGQIWQFLSYPFAVPESVIQSPIHGVLFACELLLPLLIIVGLGRPIEREIGWQRFLLTIGFITIMTALLSLPVLRAYPELGRCMGGPVGLALGLLSFHLFLFREQRVFGVMPVPFVFLVLSSGLVALVIVFALGFVGEEVSERVNDIVLLLGVLIGGAALFFDGSFKRATQRRRDRLEVALVFEEVEARARVEELLGKISAYGMGSLTRREKRFLKHASRFYFNQEKPKIH